MPKKPVVSVVVPIFNVAKYLRQAVDSIINQTYKNLEIILVDDGSTDESGAICDEYAAHDSRIVVIHNKNGGLGIAYNTGIRRATGKYIALLEPDDWIDSKMYETMVHAAEKNKADVVKSCYYSYSTTNGEKNKPVIPFDMRYMNRVIRPSDKFDTYYRTSPIWASLYNRKFLIDNDIWFLETPGASYQDTGFVRKTWAMAQRAYIVPNCFYHYRTDNVNSSVKSQAKVLCVADEWKSIYEYLGARFAKNHRIFRILPYQMLHTYMWNANRLGGNARREFIARFAADMRPVLESGKLNYRCFDNKAWAEMMTYIYPESRWLKIKYTLIKMIRPIFKVKIKHDKRVVFIFSIPIKSTPIPTVK